MTARTSRKSFWYWLKRLFALLLIVIVCIQLQYVGRIAWFKYFEPSSTPFMRAEEDRLNQEKLSSLKYKWVDYNQISPYVIQAVVAGEDARYMSHGGVEWDALKRAFQNNVLGDKVAPGGSTLTQQMVKNLFLTHERSYFRKAEEIFLAPIAEAILGKKRILEIYLNIAEFGNGVFGIEAAAERYYRTTAAKLNKGQAVWLASILINPKNYETNHRTKFLDKRIERISRDMSLVKVPSRND